MPVTCSRQGAVAQQELLKLECMPSKDDDEEEATRVPPPLEKHRDAIFEFLGLGHVKLYLDETSINRFDDGTSEARAEKEGDFFFRIASIV